VGLVIVQLGAQAAALPSTAAIDRVLQGEDRTPVGRYLLDMLRGLFVRARPRR